MKTENIIINSLWIGDQLSSLELLTIHSFIEHGHEFHLWTYNPIKNLPAQVILRDANTILSSENVFRYKYEDSKHNWGKGSVAGFSDIFRFKLLFEIGGWWVDMDIVCLKPFDLEDDYAFAHTNGWVSANILKFPKNTLAMKESFEESISSVDENNTDWNKTLTILNDNIKKHRLVKYLTDDFRNLDSLIYVSSYIHYKIKIPTHYFSIHWCNTLWSKSKIDKNLVLENSTYKTLLDQYNIPYKIVDKANSGLRTNRIQLLLFKFLASNPFLVESMKKLKAILRIDFRITPKKISRVY